MARRKEVTQSRVQDRLTVLRRGLPEQIQHASDGYAGLPRPTPTHLVMPIHRDRD